MKLANWFFSAAVLLLWTSGCVNLERSYPEREYFALEFTPPAQMTANGGVPIPGVLQVTSLRISPRYENRSFVYRTSDVAFESDYYRQFVANPAPLITDAVRDGLDRGRVFQNVVGSTSSQPADYVLEGTINALYGDFRAANTGQAVVEIEFLARRVTGSNTGIVLQKRYARSVQLGSRSAAALVKSWDQALGEIVAELGTDLKSVSTEPRSAS